MRKKAYYIKPLIKKEKIKINLFFNFNQNNLLANCYWTGIPGSSCCQCGTYHCTTGAVGPPYKC